MSVNVSNLKSKFASLKYEQLLYDKYFVETCFSKSFESITTKQVLARISMKIDISPLSDYVCEEEVDDIIMCGITTTTSSTTTTTTTVF